MRASRLKMVNFGQKVGIFSLLGSKLGHLGALIGHFFNRKGQNWPFWDPGDGSQVPKIGAFLQEQSSWGQNPAGDFLGGFWPKISGNSERKCGLRRAGSPKKLPAPENVRLLTGGRGWRT